MINSINSDVSMPPPPRTEQKLTSDQQSVISDTLSEFDVDNLTKADALSIVEAFSEAGIQPGVALEKSVSDAGFDAKAIGELANISEEGHRPPPPPKQSSDEISSMVEYLAELLEEKLASSNSESLSDEDKQSILAQVFEKFDIDESDSIINTTA
jgi:hypothetical protein